VSPLYAIAFATATTLVLVTVALAAQRLLARNPTADNVASGIVTAGLLFGSFAIAAAVIAGCVRGESLLDDTMWTGLFGLTGILLLVGAGRIGTGVILGARLQAEIDRGNPAAGIAAAGHIVATGVVIASCVYGTDLATLGWSLLFFVIAQLTLHLFVIAFRAVTTYGDREEIQGENVAAALSYAGVAVALGMIIGHAADGPFVTLGASLRAYVVALAGSAALYPVRQLVVGALLAGGGLRLRGGRLDEGIARHRSIGLGVLEASAYLATAVVLARLT